jgi:DNA-binding SARP family transcriptional activator
MKIGVLGHVELVGRRGPVLLAGKEQRVLALLAVHRGQRVSEDQLIDALWAESPPRTARRTLHGYVSRLRRALDDGGPVAVETAGGGYRLVAEPGSLDLDEVEQLIAEAAEAGRRGRPAQAVRLLLRAEAAWRGTSLGDLAGESPFVGHAHHLEDLRLTVVEDRVEASLQAGLHTSLAPELEQLTTDQPLRERLWRARILALYRCGRQAEALRVYQELRGCLVDELGIEPSPESRALEAAVLRQDPALGGDPGAGADDADQVVPLPTALRRSRGTPCVGRDGELARLQAAWSGAVAGRPAVALLAGPPGVGKTRLAIELAHAVHGESAIVLYGACDDGIVAPHQPFIEALHQLARAIEPDALLPLLGPGAGELTRMVPELSQRLPALGVPTTSEPETERFRLFHAVAEWLAATAGAQPVLLILEDLHWAGPSTLLTLGHVISRLGDSRLLIVATYRDTEVSLNPAMTDFLAHISRHEDLVRIEVEGLDVAHSEALMQSLAGNPLDERGRRLAERLQAETDGNPFFIQQIMRHLADTGVTIGAGDDRPDPPPRAVWLPDSVRDAVRRRLLLLPPDTQRVLASAAVFGREAPLRLLARLVDVPDLAGALEHALAARLLEEVSEGHELRYRFVHALVRTTLYEGQAGLRRAMTHARVAEAIEDHYAGDLQARLPEWTHHWVSAAPAGHVDQALEACRRAGKAALAVLAFEAAARHFSTGLDLLGQSAPSAAGVDLLLGLAESLFRTGQPEHRRHLEAAWRAVADLDDPALAARAALCCARGYWSAFGAVDEERVAAIELALTHCGENEAVRAHLQADLAAELIWDRSQEDRYTQLADDALALARQAGDQATLGAVMVRWLGTFWGLDYSAQRATLAAEGLQIASALADPVLEVQFATHGIFCSVESVDPSRLQRLHDRLIELTPTLGQPVWEYSVHYALMNYLTVRGNLDDLRRCIEQSRDLGIRLGLIEAPFLALCETGALHWWKDTYEEVVDVVADLADQVPDIPSMKTWLAAVLARCGRTQPARALLDTFRRCDFAFAPDHSQGIALAECALAAADLGDRQAAAQLIPVLVPYRHLVLRNPINAAGPTEWFLARLHGTLGDIGAANAAFTRAVTISELLGCRLWLAHIHCDWAELLAAQPDAAEEAQRHARAAADMAAALELPGIARRAFAVCR